MVEGRQHCTRHQANALCTLGDGSEEDDRAGRVATVTAEVVLNRANVMVTQRIGAGGQGQRLPVVIVTGELRWLD